MAKQRSEKSCVSSPYSPGNFVSVGQFITELICEKLAQKEKTDLCLKFWELEKWKKYYQQQVIVAAKLVKQHPWQAIVRALRHKSMWSCYSLRNPGLVRVIEQEAVKFLAEQAALASVKEQPAVNPDLPQNRVFMTLPSEARKKKSKLDLLREMDGE